MMVGILSKSVMWMIVDRDDDTQLNKSTCNNVNEKIVVSGFPLLYFGLQVIYSVITFLTTFHMNRFIATIFSRYWNNWKLRLA